MPYDYERVARELMRALRGSRSQVAMSRRLGFRTNVAYAWEAGRSTPTAVGFLAAAARLGVDLDRALETFYRRRPGWMDEMRDLASAPAVATLLSDLQAGRPIVELATTVGRNRFAVARMLHGDTEPRLPDFLRLIQATTLRLLDFLQAFVDTREMPSIARAAARMDAARRLAYEAPMAHTVLRVLELRDYRELPAHVEGFVAERLGISREDERDYLQRLLEAGQIELVAGRYQPTEVIAVDTRHQREHATQLRRFWAQTALDRSGHHPDDVNAYSLGTIALADMERLRELHRNYYRELRTLIADSQPAEALILANVMLVRIA